jgi:hypothetical protein
VDAAGQLGRRRRGVRLNARRAKLGRAALALPPAGTSQRRDGSQPRVADQVRVVEPETDLRPDVQQTHLRRCPLGAGGWLLQQDHHPAQRALRAQDALYPPNRAVALGYPSTRATVWDRPPLGDRRRPAPWTAWVSWDTGRAELRPGPPGPGRKTTRSDPVRACPNPPFTSSDRKRMVREYASALANSDHRCRHGTATPTTD